MLALVALLVQWPAEKTGNGTRRPQLWVASGLDRTTDVLLPGAAGGLKALLDVLDLFIEVFVHVCLEHAVPG